MPGNSADFPPQRLGDRDPTDPPQSAETVRRAARYEV